MCVWLCLRPRPHHLPPLPTSYLWTAGLPLCLFCHPAHLCLHCLFARRPLTRAMRRAALCTPRTSQPHPPQLPPQPAAAPLLAVAAAVAAGRTRSRAGTHTAVCYRMHTGTRMGYGMDSMCVSTNRVDRTRDCERDLGQRSAARAGPAVAARWGCLSAARALLTQLEAALAAAAVGCSGGCAAFCCWAPELPPVAAYCSRVPRARLHGLTALQDP